MKPLTKIAIAVAAVALLAATMQPAEASCATPRQIDAFGAYLVSNPNWGGNATTGGDGSCGGSYGCYDFQTGPPISSAIGGTFWAWVDGAPEGGDPAFFAGNDNGRWPSIEWTKQVSAPFTNGIYHYPGFLSLDDGPNYGPGNPPNWGFTTAIDGCVGNVTPSEPQDECTCILLTDEWDGVGYFALLSARSNTIGNFQFPDPIIRFAPIPQPTISMSERDGATGDVSFQVGVPAIPAAGDYRQGDCTCDVGFRVMRQLTGRAGNPPSSRATCTPEDYENDPEFGSLPIAQICQGLGLNWVPATDSVGGLQPVTPAGGTASIRVDCDPGVENDLYLATQLVGDAAGGMAAPASSANSFRIECGANVVDNDPSRPDRGDGQSGDAPRGRDNNRGRGNANGRR